MEHLKDTRTALLRMAAIACARWRIGAWATVLVALLTLSACATTNTSDTRIERLVDSTRDLGCTPLQLATVTDTADGRHHVHLGSGVLVHPRIIATADHVVPPGVQRIACFSPDGSEVERVDVDRIIRGDFTNFWDGDWALVILREELRSLDARPAERLLDPDSPLPAQGSEIRIVGFPGGAPDILLSSIFEREQLLITTRVIHYPTGVPVPRSPKLLFALHPRTSRDTEFGGASGGPVFAAADHSPTGEPADEPEPPILIGLYCGTSERKFLGFHVDRMLVVQRLPTRAIQDAIAELDP